MQSSARSEHDTLGVVEVPAGAYYGAHTVRALANFAVSDVSLSRFPQLIRALAEVKVAAARANALHGELEMPIAEVIATAGREVARGDWDHEFPLAIVHGGGGTAANMTTNEVIANRANELVAGAPLGTYVPVHPLDHVNRSQSTNDVYPTAMHVALVREVPGVIDALERLAIVLEAKAAEYPSLQRPGRTCLQDALPVPAAGVHQAQATALRRHADALCAATAGLRAVPLGVTAVGTGFGAPEEFAATVVGLLAEETGLPIVPAADGFDVLAHFDGYLRVIDALNAGMIHAAKLAADLRYLASTPVGEVELPAVQVGSSCMPGKVNPVIPELVLQVAYQVRGARATVEAAVAAGELELNVMEPVIARALLESLHDGGRAVRLFAERCVVGMRWNEAVVRAGVSRSFADAVRAARVAGYDSAGDSRRGGPPATGSGQV